MVKRSTVFAVAAGDVCLLLALAAVAFAQGRQLGNWPLKKPPPRLEILMYHDIVDAGEPVSDWTVTVKKFRSDMAWLWDNGYTSFLPGELPEPEELPEKSVLITFDDGYESNYRYALPILREYGMKAVVSVIVQRIDTGVPGFLTWDMIREMAESGVFEIGSHTYDNHLYSEELGLNGIMPWEGGEPQRLCGADGPGHRPERPAD